MLAAVDDIAGCFWVHQKTVVIAGYSSGGISAYRVGLQNADRAAGFPLVTSVVAGTHDGTSTDSAASLVPQSAGFVAP